MLNTKGQRQIVVSGLKKYLGCTVIRTNQTAEMPPFPYLGYNITTIASENKGTYGEYEDNTARKSVVQTFSFTAYSDDYDEALELISKARDWLDFVGRQYLADNGVIVESVGSVTDRSNLLTSEYLYSFGFDCFFTVEFVIDLAEVERDNGEIKTAEIGPVKVEKPRE